MKSLLRRACFALALLVLLQPAVADDKETTEIRPAQIEWLIGHSIPFETAEAGHDFTDLEPLREIIGDARIVGLGEGTHGTKEFFQMKHRIVEFLASEMGFTIFSIEASTPEAYRINDYVLAGEGDPKALIGGMYFWTWNTEEVLAMVEWMREFNASGRGRIEFTGFDMQTPDVAMKNVTAFLETVDSERAAQVASTYGYIQTTSRKSPFGVATWKFPIEEARGKRVRYSGYIKTGDVSEGWAGLWWRVDGGDKHLAFDNMQDRGPKGTTDWTEYVIELDVAEEATNINFGVLMPGSGSAWFDGLRVELDGELYESPERFDFDFETGEIAGYYASNDDGYRATIVEDESHSGTLSLRLEKLESRSPNAEKSVSATRTILREMEKSRARYLETAEPADVEWAIHNARIVHQSMRQRSENLNVRDQSMAENVGWILEQNPDAKIVLWAHNGHVGRQWLMMGVHLAERFGDDYLPVAFAAESGEYIAAGGPLAAHPLAQPPPGSIESYFVATGEERLILDLRLAEKGSAGSGWLTETRGLRSIGAVPMEYQFRNTVAVDAFDVLIFFKHTTPAVQLDTRPTRLGGR